MTEAWCPQPLGGYFSTDGERQGLLDLRIGRDVDGPTSHPDSHGAPDLTPIPVGEVWENPVTGERVTILELPYANPEGHATAELTALVGDEALLRAFPRGRHVQEHWC